MNFRVQCFHAPVEHFWKAGVIGNFGDFESRIRQQLRSAARGQQRYAKRGQPASQFNQSGFV